ncbi:MAG: hypothetical protein PQJ60_10090, partial [Spirochaetales bacterium]|nr:hypothetical protein [Spirochaetales bacterium]
MEITFNQKHREYKEVRPGYPDEIYENAARYGDFHENSRFLEIGAGHGNATEEVRSQWNPRITALEPG